MEADTENFYGVVPRNRKSVFPAVFLSTTKTRLEAYRCANAVCSTKNLERAWAPVDLPMER